MKNSSASQVTTLLTLYGALARPLTLMEISVALPEVPWEEMENSLREGIAANTVRVRDGFYWLSKYSCGSMERRVQDLLLDRKWRMLTRLARWFRFVPFVEFVLASGSMTIGNVHDRSDFDVVTGVRAGRIFTARYLLSALFSLLRARRLDDLQESSPDKLCFNHFITRAAYEKEPHNYYRRELYRRMVPLWGMRDALAAFVACNAWAGLSPFAVDHRRKIFAEKHLITRMIERMLSGSVGDSIEQRIARPIALRRLAAYQARKGAGERVVISDEELEFHFALNYEKRFSDLARS